MPSGVSTPRASRIVGATSVRVTSPSRLVEGECSVVPGGTPAPQATVGVSAHSRVVGVMPTTRTRVEGGSSSTTRSSSSSARARARRRAASEAEADATSSYAAARSVSPVSKTTTSATSTARADGGGHGADVGADPVGLERVGDEQGLGPHLAGGDRADPVHDAESGGAVDHAVAVGLDDIGVAHDRGGEAGVGERVAEGPRFGRDGVAGLLHQRRGRRHDDLPVGRHTSAPRHDLGRGRPFQRGVGGDGDVGERVRHPDPRARAERRVRLGRRRPGRQRAHARRGRRTVGREALERTAGSRRRDRRFRGGRCRARRRGRRPSSPGRCRGRRGRRRPGWRGARRPCCTR